MPIPQPIRWKKGRCRVDNTRTDVQTQENPVIPQPQVPEATCSVRLSERDEAAVMAVAEKPPAPNEAALQAARRFLERHG
jgi:hypothetical protein